MRTVGLSDSAYWSDHLADNTVERQTGWRGLQLLQTDMVVIVAHVHTENAAEPAEAYYTSDSTDTWNLTEVLTRGVACLVVLHGVGIFDFYSTESS